MELLAASFDWDASLRDPSAALAYLGRKPEEKLDYEELGGGVGSGVGMGVFWWDGGGMESQVGGFFPREFLQGLSEKSELIASKANSEEHPKR